MSNKDLVRLAIIGCGGFHSTIAMAIEEGKKAQLITCFDIIPERMQLCSKRFGCDQEESYEDVLKRDDIEGIVLVSPNAIHAEQAILAAEHGKHVLTEKPIANTLEDGRKMIAACEKAGVILMVGHSKRRNAGCRKAKELIENGTIGDPVMVEASVSNFLGFELTPDKFRWRGDDSGCPAGALMTMGIHNADAFEYLFGPVKTVFAYFSKLYIPAEVEDVNVTICKFESGILGYMGASYASPKLNWMNIYGTEANILWKTHYPDLPSDQYFKAVFNTDRYTRLDLSAKGKEAKEIHLTPGNPYIEEVDEFAHCIRTGDHPETDGQGALVALAYVRAAIESAQTGNQVAIER